MSRPSDADERDPVSLCMAHRDYRDWARFEVGSRTRYRYHEVRSGVEARYDYSLVLRSLTSEEAVLEIIDVLPLGALPFKIQRLHPEPVKPTMSFPGFIERRGEEVLAERGAAPAAPPPPLL